MDDVGVKQSVKAYYGDVLQSSDDLATDACCTVEATPAHVAAAIADIHPDVAERYYGCGLVLPLGLEGAEVLDLGCGAGRDAYVLSKLVGQEGAVVGVDMTAAQLKTARAHQAWHAARFDHGASNITFLEGDIERLLDLGLTQERFDVIVSNCVINLCTDKDAVFRAAHALLKPGGEMYFADVYADRRLPPEAVNDPRAHGECLAGALYWQDFIALAKASGFHDPRLVAHRPLTVKDASLRTILGEAAFQSATYRLFKTPRAEAQGHVSMATYRGALPHATDRFVLDDHWTFETGVATRIDPATATILQGGRFASHFAFENQAGDTDRLNETPRLSPFDDLTPASPCC